MVDAIIRWCLKHAFLVILGVGAIAAGGYYALTQTPVDAIPDIGEKQVIVFADWPGNNRIETLRNLIEDDRLAMLFLFPGLEVFLRINGRGRISTDENLLTSLKESGKTPKTAIIVSVEQVLFHCGKAINRARFWRPESQIDRSTLPSIGQMKVALTGGSPADAERVDALYHSSVRNDLY